MFKLVGYERKQGSFVNKETGEKVEYDNIDLFCVADAAEKPGVVGMFCDSYPAKADKLKITGAKSLDELINKPVILVQDLTAKVDEFGKSKVSIARIILDQ